MSNLVPGIGFALSSLSDFSNPLLANEIVKVICDAPVCIRPTKFGPFQDMMKPLTDLSEAAGWLSKSVEAGSLLLDVGKNCVYQVQWNRTEPPSFPFVGGDLLRKAFEKKPDVLAAFLDLAKRLALTTDVVYGDIRSMEVPGWDTPVNLRVRLPDIPNVSIYGKPYVTFFGRERIESAPFHRIEKLADDVYWLQATELVTDVVPEDVRMQIRKHLGEDAFMSGKRWRYTDGQHPKFDFSAVSRPVSN